MDNICSSYWKTTEWQYDIFAMRNKERVIGRCNGTKERDVCNCGGDVSKCDFYPEKRIKAAMTNPNEFCGTLCKFAEDIIKSKDDEIAMLRKKFECADGTIYDIEDALNRGFDNDRARDHIAEYEKIIKEL